MSTAIGTHPATDDGDHHHHTTTAFIKPSTAVTEQPSATIKLDQPSMVDGHAVASKLTANIDTLSTTVPSVVYEDHSDTVKPLPAHFEKSSLANVSEHSKEAVSSRMGEFRSDTGAGVPIAGAVAATRPAVADDSEAVTMMVEMNKSTVGDSWLAVQSKTFLRWCNYYLSQRDLKADSLSQSFTDGHLLNNLIEILSGKKLQRWKHPAKTQVQRLDNLTIGFKFLEDQRVKLVNLRVQEIEAGNEKLTMALIWAMIVHYQIEKIAKMMKAKKLQQAVVETKDSVTALATDTTPASEPVPVADTNTTVTSAKSELLAWVNSKILLYDCPPVKDFTASFRDGRALTALTDALLTEQKALISVLTTASIEHDKENLTEDEKKILEIDSDPMTATQTAVLRAENELRIPPLMDASDLVNAPQEQAVMTYIACFRDREQTLATLSQEHHVAMPIVEADTLTAANGADTGAVVERNGQEEKWSVEVVQTETIRTPTGSEPEPVTITTVHHVEAAFTDSDAVTSSSLVGKALSPTTDTTEDDSKDHSAYASGVQTPLALKTAELSLDHEDQSFPQSSQMPGTPVNTLDASEMVEEHDDYEIKEEIKINDSLIDAAPLVAHQRFSVANTDTTNELLPVVEEEQKSRSNTVTEVDVCMTNTDLQYVQARPDGSLIVDAANTSWSVWTVIDEQGTDTVYFRDHTGRYITSDVTGTTVSMATKSEQSKWHVIRGKQQKFQNFCGFYLTAKEGRVTCEPQLSMYSSLTLNFPVIEGYLRKKGRSGLKRWQSRYFAFNGAVMSYWAKKEEAGINRIPKGVYYPKHIAFIDWDGAGKFSIHFTDEKVVALDAERTDETQRWIHSLEMTGVKVKQQ